MELMIEVESVEGLEYPIAEIWKLHPVLCIPPNAYEIVHPKTTDAVTLILVDKDGKKITHRVKPIRRMDAKTSHTV